MPRIEVCHSCGTVLVRENCPDCVGPCQKSDCKFCDRHFCHACYDGHFRNPFRHQRMSEGTGQLSFAATSRQKEK